MLDYLMYLMLVKVNCYRFFFYIYIWHDEVMKKNNGIQGNIYLGKVKIKMEPEKHDGDSGFLPI